MFSDVESSFKGLSYDAEQIQTSLKGLQNPRKRFFMLNPFTAMMSFENFNKCAKFETFKRFCLLYLHWHVKVFSLKCTALKVDVIGPENIMFAGTSVQFSAPKFYRLGQ